MRILIALLLAAALVVGIGFYRGWFRVSSDRSAGESNVTVTVDKDQVKRDAQGVKGTAQRAAGTTAATAESK